MKKKKYLIINFSKLNFESSSNLIFVDEYLFRLYEKEDLKKYNYAFATSLNSIENFKHNKDYIKKKMTSYRKQLSTQLNAFHNTDYSTKYWGIIIDSFLHFFTDSLIKEINLIKNAKKKFKNLWIYDFFFNEVFFDSNNIKRFIAHSQNYQKLVRTIIAKEIGIKIIEKKNKKNLKKEISGNELLPNIKSNFATFFFRFYIFIFKPILILDGYFGKKNSIKIFLKSFGKIFFLPKNKFFYKKKYFFKIDEKSRNEIKVLENDLLDKIFNSLIGKLLPVTFLEGFNFLRKQDLFFARRISKIGTAVNLQSDDHFTTLTAEILKNSGKLITFQHGGLIEEELYSPLRFLEKDYSAKRYLWTNPKGLGQHFLKKFDKIFYPNFKNNKQILIFPTQIAYQKCHNSNLKNNNHPYLDQNYDFFKHLNIENKNRVLLKLFPFTTSKNVKKIWKKKFGNKINFAETYSSKAHHKVNYYQSRLVVINDLNTPLFELMYIGIPFIIIMDNKFNEYMTKFEKNLRQLEKINILYRSPVKAAEFVNKNYDKIADWWEILSKEKKFTNFKKTLFIEKKNYISSITKELIKI